MVTGQDPLATALFFWRCLMLATGETGGRELQACRALPHCHRVSNAKFWLAHRVAVLLLQYICVCSCTFTCAGACQGGCVCHVPCARLSVRVLQCPAGFCFYAFCYEAKGGWHCTLPVHNWAACRLSRQQHRRGLSTRLLHPNYINAISPTGVSLFHLLSSLPPTSPPFCACLYHSSVAVGSRAAAVCLVVLGGAEAT